MALHKLHKLNLFSIVNNGEREVVFFFFLFENIKKNFILLQKLHDAHNRISSWSWKFQGSILKKIFVLNSTADVLM